MDDDARFHRSRAMMGHIQISSNARNKWIYMYRKTPKNQQYQLDLHVLEGKLQMLTLPSFIFKNWPPSDYKLYTNCIYHVRHYSLPVIFLSYTPLTLSIYNSFDFYQSGTPFFDNKSPANLTLLTQSMFLFLSS